MSRVSSRTPGRLVVLNFLNSTTAANSRYPLPFDWLLLFVSFERNFADACVCPLCLMSTNNNRPKSSKGQRRKLRGMCDGHCQMVPQQAREATSPTTDWLYEHTTRCKVANLCCRVRRSGRTRPKPGGRSLQAAMYILRGTNQMRSQVLRPELVPHCGSCGWGVRYWRMHI